MKKSSLVTKDMASDRPELPSCFLGAQIRFSELKLRTDSHKDAEFNISGINNVLITLKAEEPVKVVTKLIQVATDHILTDFVLLQRRDKNNVQFHLGFPENGWYKFMIFALEESDPSDSLPNVYNYLIHVSGITQPAHGFVKAYTKFYTDCCYLEEPLFLDSSSDSFDRIKFTMVVPDAEKVAVHCIQEWFQLSKRDSTWEGSFDLSQYKGREGKIQVMACYEQNSCTYNALLEYTI